MKILIVDDEADILELLEYTLTKEGYQVSCATNGKEALLMAKQLLPDFIIMDIMMPIMNGIEACKAIREIEELKNVYILFLTARTEEYSELAGFEAGADDYLHKPIKPRVLLSRIKAMSRRGADALPTDATKEETALFDFGELRIVRDEYVVYKANEEIVLPRKEFELLYLLASKPNKLLRREEILEKIWGDVNVIDRTIDVHIRKLREKLGDHYIQTVKGVGYKFIP